MIAPPEIFSRRTLSCSLTTVQAPSIHARFGGSFRALSSLSSSSTVTKDHGGVMTKTLSETPRTTRVKGVYLSRKIDVFSMYEQLKVGRLLMEDEYLIVPLTATSSVSTAQSQGAVVAGTAIKRRDLSAQRSTQAPDLNMREEDLESSSRFCVFFSHGAVVFFNCDEKAEADGLEQAKRFSKATNLTPMQREEFELEIDPGMQSYSKFVPNKLNLRSLDIKSVAVISNVLGQAVALRHFEDEIDRLLEDFEKRELEAVRILRESSKVVRDVILNLGLLDHASGSNPAWQEEEYHQVWAGLRDEFEIEKRWKVLQTKATFLQDNLRFAVELSHARTSERLEIAIIALISAELLISVYHLLG